MHKTAFKATSNPAHNTSRWTVRIGPLIRKRERTIQLLFQCQATNDVFAGYATPLSCEQTMNRAFGAVREIEWSFLAFNRLKKDPNKRPYHPHSQSLVVDQFISFSWFCLFLSNSSKLDSMKQHPRHPWTSKMLEKCQQGTPWFSFFCISTIMSDDTIFSFGILELTELSKVKGWWWSLLREVASFSKIVKTNHPIKMKGWAANHRVEGAPLGISTVAPFLVILKGNTGKERWKVRNLTLQESCTEIVQLCCQQWAIQMYHQRNNDPWSREGTKALPFARWSLP